MALEFRFSKSESRHNQRLSRNASMSSGRYRVGLTPSGLSDRSLLDHGPPRYNQSLRETQPGDEAKGTGAGRFVLAEKQAAR